MIKTLEPDTLFVDGRINTQWDELPWAEALAVARRLASGPTVAYASVKAALAFSAGHPLAAALDREAELQSAAGASADHREAVAAFLAKRPAVYAGR